MLIYNKGKYGLRTGLVDPDYGLKFGLVTDAQLHVDYIPLRIIT